MIMKMESFKAGGELPKEEGGVIGEYKACMKRLS